MFLFSFWPLQLVCGSLLWHAGFSEGVCGHSTSIFMHVHSLACRFISDCLFAEWDLLLSGDNHLESPHAWHLRWVSPDSCSCHPSPQMCFHTYPSLFLNPFCLQCAGEQSPDLPWPGQRSYEVRCLSDSGKWMLLWGDWCDSLSFQAPIILHSDTQLHKIHNPIIQTTSSLSSSLFSAVWLSCLFVSVNSVCMASAAQMGLLLLSWTKCVSLTMQMLCLSLARPTWWNDGVCFLTVCKIVTLCVHRMERLTWSFSPKFWLRSMNYERWVFSLWEHQHGKSLCVSGCTWKVSRCWWGGGERWGAACEEELVQVDGGLTSPADYFKDI